MDTQDDLDRARLLDLLVTHAYEYKPQGFVLTSGQVSDEYLDCRAALSLAEALPPLGRLVSARADPRAIAVGGLTMGADPIAISAAYASGMQGRSPPLRWFSVRKDAREHGKKRMVEGTVAPGDPVLVVDDVATTGGSTIQAMEKCRSFGLNVVQALVLVDREEGGLDRIRDAGGGIAVTAIFTKSEVRRGWEAKRSRA
jgi:orotate phosphoribosyltransferase